MVHLKFEIWKEEKTNQRNQFILTNHQLKMNGGSSF